MTSNIDRAVEVIGEAYQEAMDSGTPSTWRYQIARSLADAGLLAPDLPEPKPRTLKEMTREERETCRWMQADFDDGIAERPIRVVITKIYSNTADIILPDGATFCVYLYALTPLPDLPRMVWPDEHPAAVARTVRLRRKIIALRDTYAAPDDPGDDYGRGMEAAYQIAARDLTRILNGDNHE